MSIFFFIVLNVLCAPFVVGPFIPHMIETILVLRVTNQLSKLDVRQYLFLYFTDTILVRVFAIFSAAFFALYALFIYFVGKTFSLLRIILFSRLFFVISVVVVFYF